MTEKMAGFIPLGKKGNAIKVVGVGGGGNNAVNYMCKQGICDVDFVVCNTDSQALDASPVRTRVQLGASLTEGRGAGNKPETGKKAALENIDDVMGALGDSTKMVFITAGMGGGTGTGGAPVIAEACQKKGYLTVGIVTIPFMNEGRRRIKQAIDGIAELEAHVDSLLVINNERIREMYGDFGISEAFSKADNILATAAKGIAEIITVPGYINVDFADVETVMRKSGLAVMGTGVATGENRAEEAVEKALNSPLLNNNDIRGAKNILLNITSGSKEVTMDEVGRISDYIQNKSGFDADIIWGNGKEGSLDEEISVTLIVTGISKNAIPHFANSEKQKKEEHFLSDDDTRIGKKKAPDKFAAKGAVPGTKQRTIEFDIEEEKKQEDSEFELFYHRAGRERLSAEKKNEAMDCSDMSEEDVDEYENVPAYKRRMLRMNDPNYKQKVSKYSITKDNEIKDKNTYLHDQVD